MGKEYKKNTSFRKSTRGIAAFDLEITYKEEIDDFIEDELDFVDDLKEVIERVTCIVHSIPELFKQSEKIDLGNIRLYIGRTANGGTRIEKHLADFSRRFAIPVCRVKKDIGAEAEEFGIRFLKYLEKKEKLCVGRIENLKKDGGSANRDSTIYISFDIDSRLKSLGDPSELDHEIALGALKNELDDQDIEITKEDLKDCLKEASDTDSGFKLFWSPVSRAA